MKALLLIVITAFALNQCNEICTDGNGNLQEKVIQILPNFTGVSHPYSGEVFLAVGQPGVVLVTDNNLLDRFEFPVVDGIIRPGDKDNRCFNPTSIYMRFYAQKYESIEANGSADWTSEHLDNDLYIKSNGSGDINLTGESEEQTIVINGSGDVILDNMPTVDATITVNGSGNCKVRPSGDVIVQTNGSGDTYLVDVQGKLTITINGSGDVYYTGTPIEIVSSIHGSGQIIKQ